jgi:hypothetical protein
MRARSLIAVAVLLAIGASACGSSSKNSTGSVSSAPTSPGAAGSSSPTTTKLKGSSSSNFCDAARSSDKAFSGSAAASLSAADLKKDYEKLGPELQHITDIAPSAIKGDFQTFVDAFEPYLKALADANYDFAKVDVTKLQGIGSAQVQAASAHITQYLTQVCGLTTPTT